MNSSCCVCKESHLCTELDQNPPLVYFLIRGHFQNRAFFKLSMVVYVLHDILPFCNVFWLSYTLYFKACKAEKMGKNSMFPRAIKVFAKSYHVTL